jgi:hypothetical protein
VQQIEIEKVGAEARETGLASTRHSISRYFLGFQFGDQEYTVTLAHNRATNQFLGASVAVIPRRINQTHPERYACSQRYRDPSVNAAFGRLPCLDSRLQRRDGNAGIDRAADRPAARAVGATIRPAIVHGFGGIGKSTLAREYAFASQQAV